jgi:hypothetical protein
MLISKAHLDDRTEEEIEEDEEEVEGASPAQAQPCSLTLTRTRTLTARRRKLRRTRTRRRVDPPLRDAGEVVCRTTEPSGGECAVRRLSCGHGHRAAGVPPAEVRDVSQRGGAVAGEHARLGGVRRTVPLRAPLRGAPTAEKEKLGGAQTACKLRAGQPGGVRRRTLLASPSDSSAFPPQRVELLFAQPCSSTHQRASTPPGCADTAVSTRFSITSAFSLANI